MKYRISIICACTGEILGEAFDLNADEAGKIMTVLNKPSVFGNDHFTLEK